MPPARLYVADTNNHAIRTIDLANGNQVATLTIEGLTPPQPVGHKSDAKPSFPGAAKVKVDTATVKPVDGAVTLHVNLTLPRGYKINPDCADALLARWNGHGRTGGSAALDKLQDVDPPVNGFDIRVPVKAAAGEEQLKVSLAYYYCQQGPTGLCKAGSVIWTVPVKVSPDAAGQSVTLEHRAE